MPISFLYLSHSLYYSPFKKKKHNLVITCVCNVSDSQLLHYKMISSPFVWHEKAHISNFSQFLATSIHYPMIQPYQIYSFLWTTHNCLKCPLFYLSLKTWFQTGATLKSCSYLFSYSLKNSGTDRVEMVTLATSNYIMRTMFFNS